MFHNIVSGKYEFNGTTLSITAILVRNRTTNKKETMDSIFKSTSTVGANCQYYIEVKQFN